MKRALKEKVNDRFVLYRLSTDKGINSFSADIDKGLSAPQKYILPKYFYDDAGSELFELICSTPEYYLTRTETSIISKYSDTISQDNKEKNVIVELGSGTSVKTRMILISFSKTRNKVRYIPIDVSEILIESSLSLIKDIHDLCIEAVNSEYEDGLELVKDINDEPVLYIFLGSSIGNYNITDAIDFVKFITSCMHPHDELLIGFDMVKDREILNDAYNDAAGYTEKFNKNLLYRINKELGGQFNLNAFRHNAFFNEKESRIEMHLVSRDNQFVIIDTLNKEFYFKKGESIHTENSFKFTEGMINAICDEAGLKIKRKFSDDNHWFSLVDFELQ